MPQPAAQLRYHSVAVIASLIVFLLAYLVVLAFAIAFFVGMSWLGIILIEANSEGQGFLVGLGFIAVGLFYLYFVLRFAFLRSRVDRSHLFELKPQQESRLFGMLSELSDEIGVRMPAHVYVSDGVEAFVFMESSLIGMFLPVDRNLCIGVGLLNIVTKEELKAILAHELGHFSQRSMRIGTWIYRVNQIVHSVVFDETYAGLVPVSMQGEKVGLFVLVMQGLMGIVRWILARAYWLVAVSHHSLLRAMEFHADAVAGRVAMPRALANALLRLPLAQQAMGETKQYYQKRFDEKRQAVAEDLYPQIAYVMHFLADRVGIPIVDGLPRIPLDRQGDFISSKLVLDRQWQSHPSTNERISALANLPGFDQVDDATPASTMITNLGVLQAKMTKQWFQSIVGQAFKMGQEDFEEAWTVEHGRQFVPKVFNRYFDHSGPELQTINLSSEEPPAIAPARPELFDDVAVANKHELAFLVADAEIVKAIAEKKYKLRTFDYDGIKYARREARKLLGKMETRQAELQPKVVTHERSILKAMEQMAEEKGKKVSFDKRLADWDLMMRSMPESEAIVAEMWEAMDFLRKNLNEKTLPAQLKRLHDVEKRFKADLKRAVQYDFLLAATKADQLGAIKKYLSQEWSYIKEEELAPKAVQILHDCMVAYSWSLQFAASETLIALLHVQAELLSNSNS